MRFLFWCSNTHLHFKIPEFESIFQILSLQFEWIEKNEELPWFIIELNSVDDARKVLSRSISTKHCIHLWAKGATYQEFHENLKSFPFDEHKEIFSEEKSFKISVDTYMKNIDLTEKLRIIDTLDYLPTKGPVKLKSPDYEFSYLEFWGTENNNLPPNPFNIFFGLSLGEGQRHLITKQSIRNRKFIGNTTMDPQLALLMANLGKVDSTSLVWDPFVGTGSLLLAAAEFKGHVFGGDIDFLQLHARTRSTRAGIKDRNEDESMIANFQQYGLTSQYGDVIACDFSKSFWRSGVQFDVIVTDPPYGIREQMTKVGTDKDYSKSSIPEEYLKTHVPEKVSYSLEHILEDLINFSAKHLTLGGRLVYWIPVMRQIYQKSLLPSHPALNILYDCEQILSSHTSRWLIVMEKHSDIDGKTTVHPELTNFKDQFYIPLAGKVSRRERRERIKLYGHLNFSEAEMKEFTKSAKSRSKSSQDK